ncbi:hypothetical protein F5Y18DRAFT_413816 [Xylariaceae sp. FL1019]|nr:hypothetical protein F5Y18DRAFT_413816 [Xylariaceae sp. FL1019]
MSSASPAHDQVEAGGSGPPTVTQQTSSNSQAATTDVSIPHNPPLDSINDNCRLYLYFEARLNNYWDFRLQVFTRTWRNFSGRPGNPPERPGALGALPPELRYMIYDLVLSQRFVIFDLNAVSVPPTGSNLPRTLPPGNPFAIPAIAHTCKEMRIYAMRRYQFVWYEYEPLRFTPQPHVWGDPQLCRVRAYDPRADIIIINLVCAVWVRAYGTAIEWEDPFARPRLLEGSISPQTFNRCSPQIPGLRTYRFMVDRYGNLWQDMARGLGYPVSPPFVQVL